MDDVDKLENYIPSCEVADIIGRDVRTVQKLTKDGTLTCEKKKNKNLYNLYTVVREYCDYVAKLGKKKISSVEEEKALEEVRIKRAKAELAELEMQELKGKRHAAEDVEQMTSDLVMVIRSSFMALPGRVAVELAGINDATELSERLKTEVNAILEDLSNYEYDPEEYRKRVRYRRGWISEERDDE